MNQRRPSATRTNRRSQRDGCAREPAAERSKCAATLTCAVRRVGVSGARSQRYEASRSCCASGSVCSFFSVRFSIWRTRSRVMLNACPTSSRVRGRPPTMP